jgi:hypothetical protein
MPALMHPSKLKASFEAASRLIKAQRMPSALLEVNQRLYRLIDPTKDYSKLTKPAAGGFVSKEEAFHLMIPADGSDLVPGFSRINRNRFSGLSENPSIPPAAGLYFSLQQQALMNETMHYANFLPHEPSALQIEHTSGRSLLKENGPLSGKCILQFRVLGTMLVADLSPHHSGARDFFSAIGKNTWNEVQDPNDCSVARGIGLAVANSGFLSGLIAQTVRVSDQPGKCGDNVLLYAVPGRQIQRISLERAMFFDTADGFETFPSAFTAKGK